MLTCTMTVGLCTYNPCRKHDSIMCRIQWKIKLWDFGSKSSKQAFFFFSFFLSGTSLGPSWWFLFTLSCHSPLGMRMLAWRASKAPRLTLTLQHSHPGPLADEGGNGRWSLDWDKDGEARQALENQGDRTGDEPSLQVPGIAFFAHYLLITQS